MISEMSGDQWHRSVTVTQALDRADAGTVSLRRGQLGHIGFYSSPMFSKVVTASWGNHWHFVGRLPARLCDKTMLICAMRQHFGVLFPETWETLFFTCWWPYSSEALFNLRSAKSLTPFEVGILCSSAEGKQLCEASVRSCGSPPFCSVAQSRYPV